MPHSTLIGRTRRILITSNSGAARDIRRKMRRSVRAPVKTYCRGERCQAQDRRSSRQPLRGVGASMTTQPVTALLVGRLRKDQSPHGPRRLASICIPIIKNVVAPPQTLISSKISETTHRKMRIATNRMANTVRSGSRRQTLDRAHRRRPPL